MTRISNAAIAPREAIDIMNAKTESVIELQRIIDRKEEKRKDQDDSTHRRPRALRLKAKYALYAARKDILAKSAQRLNGWDSKRGSLVRLLVVYLCLLKGLGPPKVPGILK